MKSFIRGPSQWEKEAMNSGLESDAFREHSSAFVQISAMVGQLNMNIQISLSKYKCACILLRYCSHISSKCLYFKDFWQTDTGFK